MVNGQFTFDERKDYYYTTLYRAALTISSSLELDEVLQNIVQSVTEAMKSIGARAAVLRLLDQESGQLQVAAAYGLSDEYLKKGPLNLSYSKLDQEISDAPGCLAVAIADVRTDERFRYREAAAREGLVSALCAPLKVHNETIGVIRVYTDRPTTFGEEDKEFLSVLASLAAQAIDNARLYHALKSSYAGVVDAFWGTAVSA
ncbi:MAG: GAF domain-containing protein [Ktedonobacteraceae bacterium]|nr:GAF domain-containing protein [Ktedonobacteraceae bacterium]